MSNTIITVGREFGSGGHEIAADLARKLDIPLYDKEILTEAARNSGFSEDAFMAFDETRESSLLYALATGNSLYGPELPLPVVLCLEQFRTIGELAEKGSCVFVGRCADYVLREREDVLSVFVHAPLEARVRRICDLRGISRQEAEKLIIRSDRKRANYYQHYTDWTWGAASTYHLSIDSSLTGIDGGVVMIETMLRLNGLL